MGVRLASQENVVAIFDSVTGWAFGPTFEHDDKDALQDLYADWLAQTTDETTGKRHYG